MAAATLPAGLRHCIMPSSLSAGYISGQLLFCSVVEDCGIFLLLRNFFVCRGCMRLQSFVAPYNPGITAAEALTAPFFDRGLPH